MNPNNLEKTHYVQSEISYYDVIQFIEDGWKQVLVAGIFGAVLGFMGWFFFGSYKAELTIRNDVSHSGLDAISWRLLQKSLPNLASRILAEEKLGSDVKSMYREMGDAALWIKDIVPTFAFSKAEIKDLLGSNKEIEAASANIISFNIHTAGKSSDSAINLAALVAEFLKSGGAYLQLKNLLDSYAGPTATAEANIQNEISSIEIEQIYLRDRIKAMEDLQKRFPANPVFSHQIADSKDANAKYLPLTTQIIATSTELNYNKERLIRLNDRLNQINLIKQFLAEALPLAETEFDGILLSKALVNIEDRLRKGLSVSDVKNRQFLDQLQAEILTINIRFNKGLQVNAPPESKKTGMLKSTAVGLAVVGFLMVVFLLGRKVLGNLKNKVPQLS